MKLLIKKKMIDFNLFTYYFKYLISSDMYKELSQADRENNKLKVNFIKDDITDLKKTSKMCLKVM